MIKFQIKMMTNRKEGYKVVALAATQEEAAATVNALKMWYEPLDVYYMYI